MTKPAPDAWFRPPADEEPAEIVEETIAARVLRPGSLRNLKDVAVADDLAGVHTYERLLTGVLIQRDASPRCRIATSACCCPRRSLAIWSLLGLMAAGKLPIVLNWTTGPANLAHAVKLMGVRHVVTSRTFLNRLGIEIPGVELIFLEDIRRRVRRVEKVRTLMRVRYWPKKVRAHLPRVAPDDPAGCHYSLSGSGEARWRRSRCRIAIC